MKNLSIDLELAKNFVAKQKEIRFQFLEDKNLWEYDIWISKSVAYTEFLEAITGLTEQELEEIGFEF